MIRVYCMGFTKKELKNYLVRKLRVPVNKIQDSGEEDQLHVYLPAGSSPNEPEFIKTLETLDHDFLAVP
jgi:hypothetical protein